MPWNDSENKDKDPWKRQQQQQPDLDEVIRRLQERFGGLFGSLFGGGRQRNRRGNNDNDGGTPSFLLPLLLIIASIIWGFSGFYMVAADEQAVVLRFGQHIDTTKPGWGYHLPYPIETIEKLPVTRIQRVEVGFTTLSDGRIRKVNQESLMLTKDENIVDISFIVQYKIKDVAQYLFKIDRGMKTVRDVAESAIREEIGRTMIDDVLTTRKAEVEIAVEELIQRVLDGYEAGITITTVKLQDVQPPERVIREFKDVASAREDRERAKNEAQAYANDIIPKSRGEARKRVLDAEAYQAEVVERAKGESERFTKILAAYRENPALTRKRLYLETMEEVMSKSEKVILDGQVAGSVLPYLPLGRQINTTAGGNVRQ